MRYCYSIGRIIHSVQEDLRGEIPRDLALETTPDFVSLDAGYNVRLGGVDWSEIGELQTRDLGDDDAVTGPTEVQQILAAACLHTASHCIAGAFDDEEASLRASDPRLDRSLDSLTDTLWAFVLHKSCSRCASALLVTCAKLRPRQRCQLLRAGLRCILCYT